VKATIVGTKQFMELHYWTKRRDADTGNSNVSLNDRWDTSTFEQECIGWRKHDTVTKHPIVYTHDNGEKTISFYTCVH